MGRTMQDVYKRQASTWAEYGEDMGVLAGDALMIYAFEVAAKAFNEVSEAEDLKRVGRAIEILASKTGIYGMIGGQTVDVELSGGPIPKNKLDLSLIHIWQSARQLQNQQQIMKKNWRNGSHRS